MDIPAKPNTIDEVLWLLAIITIIVLATFCAFLFKKMIHNLEKALSDVIRLTVQMEMILKQIEVIPELQKDLANLASKIRSNHGQTQ